MQIKDLIKLLKTYDQNLDLVINNDMGLCKFNESDLGLGIYYNEKVVVIDSDGHYFSQEK